MKQNKIILGVTIFCGGILFAIGSLNLIKEPIIALIQMFSGLVIGIVPIVRLSKGK